MKKKHRKPRVEIYLPTEERDMWDRAMSMSKHDTLSAMVRDLVRRYYKRLLKKEAEECPE